MSVFDRTPEYVVDAKDGRMKLTRRGRRQVTCCNAINSRESQVLNGTHAFDLRHWYASYVPADLRSIQWYEWTWLAEQQHKFSVYLTASSIGRVLQAAYVRHKDEPELIGNAYMRVIQLIKL